ncbi:unnamed protein product [Rotaria socialis]|uniref:Ig-like domain-containing protein n=1 Tax=Rotaria socialis TaxID=392032 RepID=A0A820FI21_9BILA|nr:unnamed protein product [Rotaria socialis]
MYETDDVDYECIFHAYVNLLRAILRLVPRSTFFDIFQPDDGEEHGAYLFEQDEKSQDNFIINVGALPPGKEWHISISYVSELDLIQNESRIRFVVPTTIVPRYNPDKGGFSSPAGTTSKYAQTALYTIEFKCRVEKQQCVWKHTQLDRDIQADIELNKNHLNIIVAVEPGAVIALFTLESCRNDNHHQVLKADVGQDIIMSCIFDENKIEQVSFMRQMTGDILSLGSELFVHQSHIELKRFSSNRLDLKLKSVSQNDSGLYTCMLNDEKLMSFLIEIFVPPRFVWYFPLEGSVSYPENSSMNLSCHVFAIPSVNITWIHKNKNKQSKNIHYGEDLYLSSIQPSDSGLYECIASNMYHTTISRAFYVTVQYSPRVLILNGTIRSFPHETILVRCEVCSMPQVDHIYWLRQDQQIKDVNIYIKKQIINDQCSESIMKIITINEYQFNQYECKGENILGYKSDYINLQQISRVRKVKPKIYTDEINRNGRTALLLTKSHKKKKNLTITATESNKIFLSNSFAKKIEWFWLLSLFINWIRPV